MKICKLCNGLMVIGSVKWWKVIDDCPNCDGTGESFKMKFKGFGTTQQNTKYTNVFVTCPLCNFIGELVRCKSMRWSYMRCQNCLLAYNTKQWNSLKEVTK